MSRYVRKSISANIRNVESQWIGEASKAFHDKYNYQEKKISYSDLVGNDAETHVQTSVQALLFLQTRRMSKAYGN